MLAKVIRLPDRTRDEAEKPFWISYADLMTALMVLFLVVMSVAILAVTKKITEEQRRKDEHDRIIEVFFDRLTAASAAFPGVRIDRNRHVIEFGTRARFETAKYSLTAEQAQALREFAPVLLDLALSEVGKRALMRVVIEGFTDRSGSYLYNLNLSLHRSEAVLCALFTPALSGEKPMSSQQLANIRDLFMVGGYAFNAARETAADSRRVEWRLELYGVDDERQRTVTSPPENIGECQLR